MEPDAALEAAVPLNRLARFPLQFEAHQLVKLPEAELDLLEPRETEEAELQRRQAMRALGGALTHPDVTRLDDVNRDVLVRLLEEETALLLAMQPQEIDTLQERKAALVKDYEEKLEALTRARNQAALEGSEQGPAEAPAISTAALFDYVI